MKDKDSYLESVYVFKFKSKTMCGKVFPLQDFKWDLKWFFFWTCLCTYGVLSQGSQFLVRKLSVEDGLSQSQVNCIYQDQEGFIWVGTYQGLNRHDGYEFQKFVADPSDPYSLVNEDIQGIIEGEDGTLWIATLGGGISKYVPEENRFYPVPAFDGETETQRENAKYCMTVIGDHNGNLWVGTLNGLYRLNRKTGESDHFSVKSGALPHDSVRSLLLDQAGDIWVGTEDGCSVYHVSENQWGPIAFTFSKPIFEKNNAVKAMEQDSSGRIWIATRDGAFVFMPGQGSLVHLDILEEDEKTADSENIWDLAFDGDHSMWAATHDQGILRWNTETFQKDHFMVDPSHSRGITTNALRTLFFDDSGLLWIGSRGEGVFIWNKDSMVFQTWQSKYGHENSLSDNEVWGFAQSEPNSVWVSTFSGLNHVNLASGDIDVYRPKPDNPNSLTTDYLSGITVERETGHILIHSEDVLDCLDPKTGAVEHFNWRENLEDINPEYGLTAIMSQSKDVLIIAYSDQIISWNYRTNEQRAIRLFDADQQEGWVSVLLEIPGHGYWVGTNYGLYKVSPELEVQSLYFRPEKDTAPDHEETIYCLASNNPDTIWVGTSNAGVIGLKVEGEQENIIHHFTMDQGLPSNQIFGILIDNKGLVWVSTMAGLTRINPENGRIKNFDHLDGLPGNEFNGGAYLKGLDGRLFFGGVTGFVSFFPEELTQDKLNSSVVFTHFKSTEQVTTTLKDQYRVKLSYRDSVFHIDFAVLDFTRPRKNRFRTKLEGYQTDWTNLGTENRQTFTNIDPGNYTYLVQGISSEGTWGEKPLSLHILIESPPWRSHWAYAFYLCFAGSIIGLIWRLQYVKNRDRRRNTLALKEREERLKLALWGSGATMWDWEAKDDSIMYTEISGTTSAITKESFSDYINGMHVDDRDLIHTMWNKHLKGETEIFLAEYRKKDDQGSWVWIRQRGMVVQRGEREDVIRIAGTLKDITFSKESENNLKLLASAFENTLEAMVITDAVGNILKINTAFTQITGYSSEQIIGKPFSVLNSSHHDTDFFQKLNNEIEENGAWQGEVWMENQFKRVFPTWRTSSLIKDSSGRFSRIATVFLDITEHKKQENELRILANYDHLTGLPNRTLFHDRLHQALIHSKRNLMRFSLLFLDLDRFKWINDSFGHKYGDLVLKEVAVRLKAMIREQDTVARLGGDEFIIILEDIKNSRNSAKIAETLINGIGEPMQILQKEFVVSCSIGVAMYPEDGENDQVLMTNSDAAMYYAKKQGRNHFQFYTKTMNQRAHAKLDLETRLRAAIKNQEFTPYFQPRVSLSTGETVGAEVLLRWNEPEKGMISPKDFIPIAEESGLIIPIIDWLVQETCRIINEFQAKKLKDIVFSINLSSRQFKSTTLVKTMSNRIIESGVDPSLLEMEITEGTIMEKTPHTLDTLRMLKQIGLKISVDDFGTGYSSLSYLQRFPIDALKIDKSFITDQITRSDRDAAIVKTIINLGHNLGMEVVAEGIETEEHLQFLKRLGCDEGQGYLFSEPMPQDELEAYLRSNKSI